MKKSRLLIGLILAIWFVLAVVTNTLGPLLPMVISDFRLSLTLAAFLPFSFFLAYGIISIPAGLMIERYGGKRSLLIAFCFAFTGAFLFVLFPTYGIVLSSLFIIGIGMAMLQVILLPLMREVGGERNYAFNSVLVQFVFGSASFITPFILTGLLRKLSDPYGVDSFLFASIKKVIPESLPWSSMYLLFVVVFALMLLIIALVKFPQVVLKEDEKAGTAQNYKELIKNKYVILFFLGIVAYVGTEQGMANWMSQFLKVYHGIDPEGLGATCVAWFWGLMTIGCLLGLVIIKLIDSKIMLRIFAVAAIVNLIIALLSPTPIAIIAFPCCGFTISIMFSMIFSLALNSVKKYHGAFSGILCTGMFGGALIPFLIGWVGDFTGLRLSLFILVITLCYIFSISFWAKPFVQNKKIFEN